MLANVLAYGASLAIAFWGVAHIVKTAPVVAGFEPLSHDNRLVLKMEWILEGVTLCFIGLLVSAATLVSDPDDSVVRLVYRGSALMLLIMAAVSPFTGARAAQLPYKLCPVIFSSAAFFLVLASVV